MTKAECQKDTQDREFLEDVSFWPPKTDRSVGRLGWMSAEPRFLHVIRGLNAMQDSKVRGLSVFLRVYGWASLLLFTGLMIGFVTKAQALDEGSSWHWLIWDRVGDHVAPMLLAVYIVWSIFIIRAARDPLANKTFLDFTIWANVAHGIAMVPHALMAPDYHIKFLTDIPWVFVPAIAIPLLRPRETGARSGEAAWSR
jgi:hypothetical protein